MLAIQSTYCKYKFKFMKKLIMFLFVLTVLPSALMAQEVRFGVHAGVGMWGLYGGDKYLVNNTKMKVGGLIGGEVSYEFKNHLTLNTGLDLLFRQSKFSILGSYYPLTVIHPEVNSKSVALQLPLTVGYNIQVSPHVAIVPSIGMYVSCGVAGLSGDVTTQKADGKITTGTWKMYDKYVEPTTNYNIDAFKRFDYGMTFEAKMLFRSHYTGTIGYTTGFAKQTNTYGLKNNAVTLSMGYRF